MPLNTNPKQSSYGPGVYISEATIVSAEDKSGTKPEFLSSTPSLYIAIKLDIGKDFQPEMSFFGDFKRDEQNPAVIVDWGSAYRVRNLFTAAGIHRNINEDGSIPQDMIEDLIGKKILRLQYVSGRKDNGKLKYYDWNDMVLGAKDDPKRFADLFFKSVERGYPKNYSPEALAEDTGPIAQEDEKGMEIPSAEESF
jgi:hypothetical protein